MQESNKAGDILVVDDTVINVRILVSLLQDTGYQVRAATNGKAALMICKKRPPDLVLLDVMMPEMDGYEVCRLLKADEVTRDIPIVFISALNDTDDKLKGYEVGAIDFIVKPFESAEVLARVKNQTQLQALKNELKQKNLEIQQLKEALSYQQCVNS